MNKLITKKLEEDKVRLIMEYNRVDKKHMAVLWVDDGKHMHQWWQWLSGIGTTPKQALDKLAEQIAIEEA